MRYFISSSEAPDVFFFPQKGNGKDDKNHAAFILPARSDKQLAPRILIVEDERLVAEHLKQTIEPHGYQVVEIVSSGEDAIRRFSGVNPDLILMDVRLKGTLDGIQTALVIQQTVRHVPVLFITAFSEDQFPHLNAVKPSLYGYLTKPYSEADLIAAIEKLLKETQER